MTNPKNQRDQRNQRAKSDHAADNIPNPNDKPHLDSGLDPNNVTINGVSLLNPQGEDNDWDIPALSFPTIDEHGVAPSSEELKHSLAFPSVPADAANRAPSMHVAGEPRVVPSTPHTPADNPDTQVAPPAPPAPGLRHAMPDKPGVPAPKPPVFPVSYTHPRAHQPRRHIVCLLFL
ncbi:hypothetical protein JS528_05735, partial [Bifidobacterium sp. MA2]|nr:hypothetical protein [Bifidobacterium santillanense]